MEQQLSVKDDQLSVKDEQIRQLMEAAREERKRPRVQNKNTYIENHVQVMVYGKEVESAALQQKMAQLIQDPDNSVAAYITLRAQDPKNRNVVVPNTREPYIKVLREEGWQHALKETVLPEILQDAACKLSAHADEETATGKRYMIWHDRLLTSVDQRGQLCKEQEKRVFRALADATREKVSCPL